MYRKKVVEENAAVIRLTTKTRTGTEKFILNLVPIVSSCVMHQRGGRVYLVAGLRERKYAVTAFASCDE